MRRKKSTGYLRFFFLRVVDVRRPAGDAPRDGAPGAVAAPGAAGTGAPWPLPSAEVAVAARRRGDAAVRPSATAAASIWLVLTPMKAGLLKKAKPASTPSMARVNSTAVSMLTSTPRMSVRAKPLGEAVANTKITAAVSIVLSLIHISEPTRLGMSSYAVFCL